ncbi:hypothetical protein [Streptomyces sp. NPDC002758]
MSPTPLPDGAACSADELNAQIRALLERTRRQLTDVERAEYDGLVLRWEAAKRGEVVEAA